MLQNETHFYAAGMTRDAAGSSLVLYRRNGKDDPLAGVALRRVALPDKATSVSIRFRMDGPRLDVVYALDANKWRPLLQGIDASLLSTASAGGFTGVTFGPYAYRPNPAD